MPQSRSLLLAPRTATSDRGSSPYFHGREHIRRDFKGLLELAKKEETGTIFLIHGAPSAGKTALIHECKKHSMEAGWNIATITPQALWNHHELIHALGQAGKLRLEGGSEKNGFDAFVKFEAGLDFGVNQSALVRRVLRKAKHPLLHP